MESKRIISVLAPYHINGNILLIFLQKRSKDMERLPNYFGFFGGGAEEGENPEETLKREIEEELNFIIKDHLFFKKYEFPRKIMSVYHLKVEDNFEKQIEIREGDYGKYFSKEEVLNEPKIIKGDKMILRDLFNELETKHNISNIN